MEVYKSTHGFLDEWVDDDNDEVHQKCYVGFVICYYF